MKWTVTERDGKKTTAARAEEKGWVLRVWHAPTMDSWMVEVSSVKKRKPAKSGGWRESLKDVPLESVSIRLGASRFGYEDALEAATEALAWLRG